MCLIALPLVPKDYDQRFENRKYEIEKEGYNRTLRVYYTSKGIIIGCKNFLGGIMIYKITKIIKSDMNNGEFIKMCKRSFRKTVAVCTFLIALCVLLWFAIGSYGSMEEAPHILVCCAMLFTLPGFVALMFLGGNMSGYGMIIEYLDCKSIKDWAIFAERNVCNPKGAILSKRLESEDKEVIEVCLNGKELRCRNIKTGNIEIFCLNETFKEKFTFKQNPKLADGEMILDLSGKELIAYTADETKNSYGELFD